MKQIETFQKYIETFQERLHILDESTILTMRNFDDGKINNVVVGIERECYGLLLQDDTKDVIFQLFYINRDAGLTGYLLELSSNLTSRNEITLLFSRYLSQQYQYLTLYTTFNTFQEFVRKLFEQLGYYTYTDDLRDQIKGKRAKIIVKDTVKGLVYVPFIKESDIAEFDKKRQKNGTPAQEKPLQQNELDNVEEEMFILLSEKERYKPQIQILN